MYFWTEEQLNLLKSEYPKGNIDKIASQTGKSKSAVVAKARKLKLGMTLNINEWRNEIPIEIKAYIAGHFDGEGCAFFRKKDKRRLTRTPCLSVSNAHLPSLSLYKKYFNGKIVETKSGTNKQMYAWRCTKYEDIYNFILSILPYSIEKKEQILLLKDFINSRVNEKITVTFFDEFRIKAEDLHKKCTELKKL